MNKFKVLSPFLASYSFYTHYLIEHDFNPVGQMFSYAQEYQRNLIELKETLIQSEDHIRDTLSDCSQVRLFIFS